MSIEKALNCFKAYDVRGRLGEELNQEVAYSIGRATVQALDANSVVIGYDARETSPSLAEALCKGICDAGANVIHIGLAGTEEVYTAVVEFDVCAGIEVTASHNPIDYNGMKIVKRSSQPLSDREFADIKRLSEKNSFLTPGRVGEIKDKRNEARAKYISKITQFVNLDSLKPLKIVINSGNGAAGPTIDELNKNLKDKGVQTHFIFMHHDPDPSFPNGIPNPLLKENRSSTAHSVVSENADFGVAFDGDFDRCFLFDHNGNFVQGEYLVGLLAEVFLKRVEMATIVHDPRVVWNTLDVVKKYSGQAVVSKTGHVFFKSTMRRAQAIYGGEMSAHHYFRDFFYCDSGMIPWLLIWELVSQKNKSLADLLSERRNQFLSSGEINFTVSNSVNCMNAVKAQYLASASFFDELDGLSMSHKTWRFNLRKSNTEPLVRLNIETKGDATLLRKKTAELTSLILKV